MDSLTRQEVRAVDRAAIDHLGIPGLILMENAGRNCAAVIDGFFDRRSVSSIAIIAGSGNNGGDGYVIARHLAMRGFAVKTLIICPREKISGDADVNLRAISALEHDIEFLTPQQLSELSQRMAPFDLIVDAIGGTGISGALRGGAAIAVEQINLAGKPVAAVDIPTGLDCDTGQADGSVVKAELTVTFVATKKGFSLGNAADYTGEVVVADIGVPAELILGLINQRDS
ncbi:MAG: NAD(P)H-hydrate epimerase [Phycisphaerales bacterium]|mgnify:CR=1 FL=1|jgi:hydroxyethylthiazole kinase-like uncharacterized protein yjeF|nr:NAD(P)H-hydrate epimerase [Phycisphaerales bacterium]